MRAVGLVVRSLFTLTVFFSITACSVRGQSRDVEHALYLCRQLVGPDAMKGDGDVWFGLQSERERTSRKLQSDRGIAEINARLKAVTDDVDRECLLQLKREVDEDRDTHK